MNNHRISLIKAGTLLALFLSLNTGLKAQEQEVPELMIGDKAPELKYGAWLKGSPIKEYKKGHLYLFEFWATWCGPCIISMPHLSEFAKAHAKDLTVVAVNIWEDKSGKTSSEALLSKVVKFVKGMGDKMAFNVTTDTKDEHMGNKWMKAAGQGGIPTSIMVKDGVIQWIGHPVHLDSIYNLVMHGNYNVAEERKVAIADAGKAPSQDELIYTTAMKAVETANENKEYTKAISIIDIAVKNISPEMAGPLKFNKFTTLFDASGEEAAMKFVKEWQSEAKAGFSGSVGAVIANKTGLSKDSYLYGINILKGLADNPQPASLMYKFIAGAYVNMGDYKGAIEAQEIAIAKAKEYLKNGKFAGFILEDTVKEYEAELAKYKEKLK